MYRSIANKLSVLATALSADPHQSPRMARQLGFRGLLFDVVSARLNLTELSNSGRREFRQLLSASDQQLIGLQLDLGAKGLAPGADVDRQISRLDRAMECTAGMESPLLCVDIGPLPAPVVTAKPAAPLASAAAGLIIIPEAAVKEPEPLSLPPPDPAFVAQVNSALNDIGTSADRYSVMMAFSSGLASFAAIEQVLGAVRCPWFGIDLDPLAILRDDWSTDRVFSALGPLVRHVRARDGSVGAQKRIKPASIGSGSVNWPQLLSFLDESDYQGWLTVDPVELSDRSTAAAKGATFLRGLGQ